MRLLPPPSIELPEGIDTPEQDAAMKRAYAWPRMLDYGACVDDASTLHREGEPARGWVATTCAMGDAHAAHAGKEREHGFAEAASVAERYAAACYRMCQSALEPHEDLRRQAYRKQASAFARAMEGSAKGGRQLDVRYEGRPLTAWHFEYDTTAPVVIVVGGADGWCEAFEPSVAAYARRGLSVCLLELPGQGLARLEHGLKLTAGFTQAISTCIDVLQTRGARTFGLAGHSLGGTLALAAAAQEPRIAACCTNGGSAFPEEGLPRYARVLKKVADMTGLPPQDTLDMFASWRLRAAIDRLQCSLLVLHGDQDVLVGSMEVDRLPNRTAAGEVTVQRWVHGEHCLYSVASERNAVMTAWFAERLG